MQDTLERHPPAPPPTLRSRNYSIHPILTSRLQQLSSTFSVFNLSPGSGPKPGADQSCPSWISSNLQGQISSRIYHLDVWYKLIIKSKFMSVSSVTNQRTDSIFISKKQYIFLIEILSNSSHSDLRKKTEMAEEWVGGGGGNILSSQVSNSVKL